MNKYVLALMIVIIPFFLNAQVSKNDMRGKIGISLYGGGNIPTNGEYSSTVKTTEFLNTGSRYGLGFSYFFTKGFGLEGSFYAGYNHHNEDYKPEGKEPIWANLSTSINAIYNFGHMFRKPVISPIVRVGIGSYHWEHFEDGFINGEITEETSNYDVNSFGFNAGVGAEYSASKKFTIGLQLDYNMYFPKHEELNANQSTTSNDRTVHGFFSPQIKLTYYIPTR
jgi:opacity protein-like surface antigen